MAATGLDVGNKLIGQSWFGYLILIVAIILLFRYVDSKCDF